MATNIKKIAVHILTEQPPKDAWAYCNLSGSYIRLPNTLDFGYSWYMLDRSGRIEYLSDHQAKRLEELFKESCGFLEQMELF